MATKKTNRRPDEAPADQLESLYGPDELAAYLRKSRRSLYRMAATGVLPEPDVRIYRSPRWKASTIRQWLDSGGPTPRPPAA